MLLKILKYNKQVDDYYSENHSAKITWLSITVFIWLTIIGIQLLFVPFQNFLSTHVPFILEIHAINNPIYNCERFGIHFTASPRFADMLLVTGPVTHNMEIALRRTYNATPPPKIVVAVGDCGCNGGIFGESYASLGGIDKVIPVNAVIHGCPPTPVALLQGILKAVEKKR